MEELRVKVDSELELSGSEELGLSNKSRNPDPSVVEGSLDELDIGANLPTSSNSELDELEEE